MPYSLKAQSIKIEIWNQMNALDNFGFPQVLREAERRLPDSELDFSFRCRWKPQKRGQYHSLELALSVIVHLVKGHLLESDSGH